MPKFTRLVALLFVDRKREFAGHDPTCVDLTFTTSSVLMSPSTQRLQSTSTLSSITPTSDLTSQKNHQSESAGENSNSYWTAPFRDGLPTPPSDMTGLTYNAMPPVAYGEKVHGLPSHPYAHPTHPYTHSRPQYDSISLSMVASMRPTHSAPAKEVPATEPVQKKPTNKTGGPHQIPSSINKSKGSLAEFAAQVRFRLYPKHDGLLANFHR